MNDPGLETLTITDFRTIRGRIALPLNAPIVLLHGTNGAGKTTIMSALQLALTGQVADLRPSDREHLINWDAEAASVELKTRTGTVGFRVDDTGVHGTPLLEPSDARFYTERCHLAQRMLGQLLEIYQDSDDQHDSALTRFVKDLLRLDELDALLDGLECLRDKRLVKRLVPEYGDAERDRDAHRSEIRRIGQERDAARAATKETRTQIDELLTKLDAPPAVVAEAGSLEEVESWLTARDEEDALVALIAARRETGALRSRAAELSGTTAAIDSAAAEVSARAAREAAEAWQRSQGGALEMVLDALRSDFPGVPSAIGAAGPTTAHATALQLVKAERDRLGVAISTDEVALAETERLDAAIATAQARIAAIDEQLVSSGTASDAEELGKAIAALIPHVHTEDCPVCGRDYGEVADEPLSARLAARVSELSERAERLEGLAKSRLEALADLRSAQDARAASAANRLEPAAKAEAKGKLARLEEAERRLGDLQGTVAEGAEAIRRAVETERVQALAHARDRASADLRVAVATLADTLGESAPRADVSLAEAVAGVEERVLARLDAVETRQELRRSARKRLRELAERAQGAREIEAPLEALQAQMVRTEGALRELERRRGLLRRLRDEAAASRADLVRRVFNRSLNRTWRDLFVRLATDEPFVPAFEVPDPPAKRVTANLETVHRDGRPGGSPGAMLSAGNLNTAALTLFLALHLSVDPRLPWLVLDDPVQSMDELHVAQFAALLRTLSKAHGRQLVLAVHEQPLFEYLALELSPAAPGDALVTVQLSRARDGSTLAHTEFRPFREDRALAAA